MIKQKLSKNHLPACFGYLCVEISTCRVVQNICVICAAASRAFCERTWQQVIKTFTIAARIPRTVLNRPENMDNMDTAIAVLDE